MDLVSELRRNGSTPPVQHEDQLVALLRLRRLQRFSCYTSVIYRRFSCTWIPKGRTKNTCLWGGGDTHLLRTSSHLTIAHSSLSRECGWVSMKSLFISLENQEKKGSQFALARLATRYIPTPLLPRNNEKKNTTRNTICHNFYPCPSEERSIR